MSEGDWIEIGRAVTSAVTNFQQGVEFSQHASFRANDIVGAALRMGFMHAVKAGHVAGERTAAYTGPDR